MRRRWPTSSAAGAVARRRRRLAALALRLRDLDERQDVGVDDLQRRLRAQLAAQQPDGFLIGVDVFVAARDEAGDQDALKCRDIELGPNRRLDRDLEVARPARERHGGDARDATAPSARLRVLCSAGPVIDFLEQLVVLTNLRVVRLELQRLFVGLARLVELPSCS